MIRYLARKLVDPFTVFDKIINSMLEEHWELGLKHVEPKRLEIDTGVRRYLGTGDWYVKIILQKEPFQDKDYNEK